MNMWKEKVHNPEGPGESVSYMKALLSVMVRSHKAMKVLFSFWIFFPFGTNWADAVIPQKYINVVYN